MGLRVAIQVAPKSSTFSELFFFALGGPNNWNLSLLETLAWFIPYLIFFYLFGNMANEELQQRGFLVFPLIGSRSAWWLSNVITMSILAITYVILYILILAMGTVIGCPMINLNLSTPVYFQDIWPNMVPITGIQILAIIFLLTTLTLFAMTSFQMTLSILLKRSIYGFLCISIIALLSCILSIDRPWLTRWLPGSQSILVRHTFIDSTIPGFSLQWSLLYDSVLSLFSLIVGFLYIRRMDIYSSRD